MAPAAPAAYVSQVQISLAGQAHAALSDDLVGLLVEDTDVGLARCELALRNEGNTDEPYRWLQRDPVDFGEELEVEIGPPDNRVRVFAGRITALEAEFGWMGGPRLVVLAEDRLQSLRLTRRTRSWEMRSDEEVISQIAGEHQLTPEVELPGPTHAAIAQINQTDLAFVRERATALDGTVWAQGGELHVATLPRRETDVVELTFRDTLHSFTVRADLAHQRGEIVACGWDVGAKQPIAETASESSVAGELGGLEGGGGIIRTALSDHPEHTERLVLQGSASTAQARELARAAYAQRARRFVTGTAVAEGDGRIVVGGTVRLLEVSPLFQGEYKVSRVRHTFDPDLGSRTEFDVRRPGLGASR